MGKRPIKNKNRTLRRILRRLFVNREVKDRLFRVVFREKKYQLQLYNAINGTNYQNEEDLIVYTLEDVIYLKMKNDLSFLIVSSTLNLYEQQSTFNPNMPIRGVLYFARQYEIYIDENDLDVYGSSLVRLPVPQMVVFYNGERDMPEESELKLSDAFMDGDGCKPAMECVARMINIGYGHNRELMEKCQRLAEYARFIQILKECKAVEKDLAKATHVAVERGIKEGILTDILLRQKAEVCAMVLTEYDEKKHMKTLYREGYDSGILENKKEIIRNLLRKGNTYEQISEIVMCDERLIKQVQNEMLQN